MEKFYKKIIFNDIDFNPVLKSNSNNINITEYSKDLIRKLLKKNPKERLKIESVINHDFFKQINLNDIKLLKIQPPFKPDSVIK